MQCQHPGCNCQAGARERDGRSYCSDACASSGTKGGPCGCGHPSCGSGSKS